jgi:hypothetical protein
LQPSGVFGQCDNCSDCSACNADQVKPEVLPWRTRLKTRIGDRLFHRGEFGVQDCCDECMTPKHSVQPAPLPVAPLTPPEKPIATPPDKPIVPEKSPPTVKTADLEVPDADLSTPELKRPDVVLE